MPEAVVWSLQVFESMKYEWTVSRWSSTAPVLLPAACSGLHLSFLICAQDLWISLSPHVLAVIIQQITCGWQRGLDWSEVRRPPGPHVQYRQRARQDAWKETECMSEMGGGREITVYETKTIKRVRILWYSLVWLAWGHSKWQGLK